MPSATETVLGQRMTDLSNLNPDEWLEHHRKQHGYNSVPMGEDADHLRIMKKRFPEAFDRLVTKYGAWNQAKWEDILIERILFGIRLTDEEKAKIGNVFFSVFPTQDVRGRKDKTARGDTVVLLHDGLIMTVWAWALLHAFQFHENSNYQKLLSDTKAATNFFAAIAGFWNPELNNAEIENPLPFELTEHSWGTATALIDSCLSFILGHEIGHLIENHAGYTGDQIENYRMEYKADNWGLRFFSRYALFATPVAPTHMARAIMLGPYLGISLIATINDRPGLRHPSASMRFERLRKDYRDTLKGEAGRDEFKKFRHHMGNEVFKRIDGIGGTMFEQHKAYARFVGVLVDGAKKWLSSASQA
jgi:hypothetical protein